MAGGKEPPLGENFRNHGRFCTSVVDTENPNDPDEDEGR
jgi:hypothetical protein